MRNEKSSLFPWILFEEREDIRGEDGIRFPLFPLLCILLSEIGLMRREDLCNLMSSRGITLMEMKKSKNPFSPPSGFTLRIKPA